MTTHQPGEEQAGTIYLQPMSGMRQLIIDNTNSITSTNAFTGIYQSLPQVTVVVTNGARAAITNDTTIYGLVLNTNGKLELSGSTLTLRFLRILNKTYGSGLYTPAISSLLSDGVGGGEVLVQASGTMVIVF